MSAAGKKASNPSGSEVAGQKAVVPVAAPARSRADQEFLPAALEILETPASPIGTWLIGVICTLVVVALAWAWFGRFDIVAIAQGKFQPAGRVKVIQPLESAKVLNIAVQNGAQVKPGDVLVELDPADAVADRIAVFNALGSIHGEIVRRLAASRLKRQTDAGKSSQPSIPTLVWPTDTPAVVRLREQRIYETETSRLASTVAALIAQSIQKEAERDRYITTIAAQKSLIEVMRERVDMRSELVRRASGTRSSVIDATESYRYQQTSLIGMEGQLAEAIANLDVLQNEIAKTFDAFFAENSQKLADAERQRDEYEQRLAKAEARLERFTLRAPINGTVYALSLTTQGQVVVTAEELMRIVPEGELLEVEAYVQNKDIGFIRLGEEAVIKVDSFPFIRYGSVPAEVTRISRDAIPEPDQAADTAAARQQNRPTTWSGGQRVQNLVFPVLLRPRTFELVADGVNVPLAPGMTVTVEIKTGSRRVLEYIFSPLVEIASTSMRER